MKFLGDDFLIDNKTGIRLYKKFAKEMAIYDFHCHLSADDIASDKKFDDVGELMLESDHYKWRLMRIAGVDEKYITGDASFKEKFIAYAGALEKALGNPLFVWTNMELKKYFGITEHLTSKNAKNIYDKANTVIKEKQFTARKFINLSNVDFIATTDDPSDNLESHFTLANDNTFNTKVVPTFRPDKLFNINDKNYPSYISKLEKSAKINIKSLDELFVALKLRMDFFEKAGCKISDHSLTKIPDMNCSYKRASEIFDASLKGNLKTKSEQEEFTGYLMRFLVGEYQKRDWVMQIHLFALRNQNTIKSKKLGSDSGFDTIGDSEKTGEKLCRFLDDISKEEGLPKTMIYTLEPSVYPIIVAALGSFGGVTPGRVQLGPAWWFCDNHEGIVEQMKAFANGSVFGCFNGMLTDSRSFLSYVRHDYFRRILCSYIGKIVENGQYPNDDRLLGEIIQGISYNNAKNYFGI